MKCDFNVSEDSSMSGFPSRFSIKFRILALVVNTANLINERTTVTFSVSHAILAPVTFTTTYILLGVLSVAACHRKYASEFLQIYSLVSCCSLQASLSLLVFRDLKNKHKEVSDKDVALVLNAVLPLLTIVLILADLILILLSKRGDMTLPSGETRSLSGRSQTHSISIMPSSRATIKDTKDQQDPRVTPRAERVVRIQESEKRDQSSKSDSLNRKTTEPSNSNDKTEPSNSNDKTEPSNSEPSNSNKK